MPSENKPFDTKRSTRYTSTQSGRYMSSAAENHDQRGNVQELRKLYRLLDACDTMNADERFDAHLAYRSFKKRTTRERFRLFSRYAAAIMLLLAMTGSFAYYYWMNKSTPASTSVSAHGMSFAVPSGSQGVLTLCDGTKVMVNYDSRIELEDGFGVSHRRLTLYGEAFFDVAKGGAHPFIVKARGVNIEVLGTHFNVRAYSENEMIKVGLIEGSVALQTGRGEQHTMLPDELAMITATTHEVVIKEGGVAAMASWREKHLIFEGETLEEILRTLERKYAVRIVSDLPAEVLRQRYSGTFIHGESLDDALEVISFKQSFNYRVSDNNRSLYTLNPRER